MKVCFIDFFSLLSLFAFFGSSVEQQVPQNRVQKNSSARTDFEIVKYNNPGLTADLGVGLWAWPIPMDFDGDGDMDLLVSCPDKPFNGVYLFENVSGEKVPVFAPPVRLADAIKDVQVSYVDGEPRVLVPGAELVNFNQSFANEKVKLFSIQEVNKDFEKKPRFNQWKYVDYDNDGDLDVVIGVDDWTDYGWDNAFNAEGQWINGPLHGYVYLFENQNGKYVKKGRLEAGGKTLDVYGAPSPNFADFDGDGDLDLICGEFLDKLTWFENIGTREKPEYAEGRLLKNADGIIKMDLQMIIPVAVDWDQDGHMDLVVGDEDGRVAFIRNTGKTNAAMPVFESPVYFKQQADNLKFGALATPFAVDWDNDGDEDLICGNSAGQIAFIENLGGFPVKWNNPVLLEADGKAIRIQAGVNGSIQGPAEAKWGYTVLSVADWDGDGLKDIIINSIWGKVEWYRNIGTKNSPKLAAAAPVQVDWGKQQPPKPAGIWWTPEEHMLATQWRTTPYAIDWNKDGLMDLVMLDHEGFLSFFERFKKKGKLMLKPGKRIFYGENASGFGIRHAITDSTAGFIRLNSQPFGQSGRAKFCIVDWDGDKNLDFLVNSVNISLLKNTGQKKGVFYYETKGMLTEKILAGHTTSPTTVDFNNDGLPDLLVGAEDGHFYYLPNPETKLTLSN